MIARTATILALALLLVPIASSQSLEEPLVAHADEKVDAAQDDPVGFASDHASEEAVAGEAEWGVAYGCFAVAYAHEEVGTPDPELEQCERYEEVLGIAPEPQEPVAIVENISEDPVAEVEEISEEAVAAVDEIVEDPLSAPEILVGLVLYLVDKVLDLVGGVGAAASGIVGEALDLVGAALSADAKLGAATYDGAGKALTSGADGIIAVVSGTASGIADAGKHVADGIGDAADAVGDGISQTADAIGDAADSVGHAVSDFVAGLFGGDESSSSVDGVDDPAGDLTNEADGLLDLVGDVDRLIAESA